MTKYNLGVPRIVSKEKFQAIRSKLPNFPVYVIHDWVMKNVIGDDFDAFYKMVNANYGVPEQIRWTEPPVVIDFTFDKFDETTQNLLKAREGGKANPNNVPSDAARHTTQAGILKGKNPQKDIIIREPVILFKRGKKYELIEGWHRTIQALSLYPNGYRGYAYVGKKG